MITADTRHSIAGVITWLICCAGIDNAGKGL